MGSRSVDDVVALTGESLKHKLEKQTKILPACGMSDLLDGVLTATPASLEII